MRERKRPDWRENERMRRALMPVEIGQSIDQAQPEIAVRKGASQSAGRDAQSIFAGFESAGSQRAAQGMGERVQTLLVRAFFPAL